MAPPKTPNEFRLLPAVFFLLVSNAVAGPLSLVDPSFAVGSGADASVNALYLQPDERILVGGDFGMIHSQNTAYLARLNSDGSIDSSFGQQGITDGSVYKFSGLPDGKILVAGSFNTLLGATRRGIARLEPDGTLDPTFDAGNAIDGTALAIAVQEDGRIWVGASAQPAISRILRLQTNGAPDDTYTSTNDLDGYVFALLPLPGGGVLAGLNPQNDGSKPALLSLLPDGRINTSFDAVLGSNSTVFTLVREPSGDVLVGGLLTRPGQPGSVPLLRLTPDLHRDDNYHADAFSGGSFGAAVVDYLLLQPDGKIVAGGYFFQVGGYWRRELVRLSVDGRVDPCFDPGLGFGGATPAGPLRCLLLQPDGRILVGGFFDGIDEKGELHNLARLLPQGPCDSIRVYLDVAGTSSTPHHFAAATFPPGGTNILETSANMQDWHEVARDTVPYVYIDSPAPDGTVPTQFFRARQER